ncbi:DUF721 domain-containing protein [Shewanella colwelliana]|uniref:RNA-binding protein n=1 Tax=Shewanella colwelliana TaxID=23 RepID=A0A1E5ITN0_SHECO|nr:DciA family protein [Shewanella colwelliana]MCZ4337829.1 DciA family protein [Shewanella colwelliana]MDX1280987.1 DciA family protein [Shewanella colwelliana]OEG73919.1 hypothetical protein BEL05_15840 [Shewanella colwelliana]GIU20872.1 DUF721 domain-containing protein [Shewanella colwelliana]
MKKPPQDLSQLLHQQGQLPSIAEKAELLLHLDHYVKQVITGPVTEQLKVANFRQGVLVIETTTAAWAARINFQKPKMLQQLQLETLPMLSAIEVKVNPGMNMCETKSKPANNHISETAAAHISALAEHTEGSLGVKLKRLAALASRSRQS